MKRFLFGLALWFGLACGQAHATTCNPPSGWLLQNGVITIGDVVQFGPQCGQLQDSFTIPLPVQNIPVLHPSSGNLLGAGCITPGQAWLTNQNICAVLDSVTYRSNDPSAIFTASITGTVTPGDTITFVFTFGIAPCNGGGCTIVYTVQPADTLNTIAQNITCAIANNLSLFRLNGTVCVAGVITNTANGYGGYGASNPHIGYIVASSNVIALDFDATVSMKVTTAVGGAGTEIVTISNAGCSVACSNSLDNNPVWNITRMTTDGSGSPIAPPASSVLFNWQVSSSSSSAPGSITNFYGSFNIVVDNSTTGAIASHWALITPNTAGTLNQGLKIGAGAYTVNVTDKGVDSFDSLNYWISGTEQITLAGGVFEFVAGAGHGIQIQPGNGSVNVTETGVNLALAITGSVANVQALEFVDSALRWEIYKSANTTDLRFFDGTADRVIFKNGGAVQIVGLSTAGAVCNAASGQLSTTTTFCANATPAAAHSQPGNPTGTASASTVMAGLAGSITTGSTGNVSIWISGVMTSSAGGDGCAAQIRIGTGTAPVNGAAATGTTVGNQSTENLGTALVPFEVQGRITGRSNGTANWIDLGFSATVGGTCSLVNLDILALETP